MPRLSAILASCALAACTVLPPVETTSLGYGPIALGGGSYSSGGGLTVAAEVRPVNGQTAVCGVWAESEQQSILTKGKAPFVIATGAVSLDGQVIHRGLGFMNKVEPTDDYRGQPATCIVTGRAWQPGDEMRAPGIHIPRQVVHREVSEERAKFIVTFKNTGPGA